MSKHPMLVRTEAVDACAAKFLNHPMKWGVRDCVKLGALAMRKQKRPVAPLKGARYKTEIGALKFMKSSGFDNLVQAVDATGLVRIAPAMTLPGDLVAVRVDDNPFGVSIAVVHTGSCRRLLFLDSDRIFRIGVPDLSYIAAAWRV